MENFSELIKNRRSMRKFTDEELTQDQVVTLMKAALMSPSSKRSNSWEVVGCRFANVSLPPECLPMNLSMEFWIFPCNFRFFLSLLSDIKGWNVNLSMKNIFNGRKFILTSSEENKYGSC